MNSNETIHVEHNVAGSRFEATVQGLVSVAEYELSGRRMIMTHTVVPSELRGRGIAEKLVRAALAYAQAESLSVVPACSYVAAFIKRHPEFQPLLAR